MGGSRLPPPVLISFTDATTGARKVSTRSNHPRRQRIVNFTGSLDSPLERAGFEPSVPHDGLWALSWTLCNGPNARVINLSAMAICAMASSCDVAMEVGSAGAGRVRIETGSLSPAPPPSGMLRLSTSRIHISAREAPWFSLSSAAPRPTRTTAPNRAGARIEQAVACCAVRRPLLAGGTVHMNPNCSFAG